MVVARCCRPGTVVVRSEETVSAARARLGPAGARPVAVVDARRRIVGILIPRQWLGLPEELARRRRAREVMTPTPCALRLTTTLADAVVIMEHWGLDVAPVADWDGCVAGTLALRDALAGLGVAVTAAVTAPEAETVAAA